MHPRSKVFVVVNGLAWRISRPRESDFSMVVMLRLDG